MPHNLSPLPADALAVLHAEARKWACDLRSGEATVADVAAFKQWRARSPAHAQAWATVSQQWKQLADVARAFERERPERLATPESIHARRRLFIGTAAAAFGTLAVAGIVRPPLGLWPSWSDLSADYRTTVGEQRAIALAANQVQVDLNTRSSLKVLRQGAEPRLELVDGEAAVSSARLACDVMAGDGVVRVAQGDVELRWLDAARVRLRCNDGQVELRHPLGTMQVPPRHEIVYEKDSLGRLRDIPAAESEWRDGMVVFQNLPLSKVVEEINRYRPGRVVLVDSRLDSRTFSASVRIDALDGMIDRLHSQDGIPVRRLGPVVLLG